MADPITVPGVVFSNTPPGSRDMSAEGLTNSGPGSRDLSAQAFTGNNPASKSLEGAAFSGDVPDTRNLAAQAMSGDEPVAIDLPGVRAAEAARTVPTAYKGGGNQPVITVADMAALGDLLALETTNVGQIFKVRKGGSIVRFEGDKYKLSEIYNPSARSWANISEMFFECHTTGCSFALKTSTGYATVRWWDGTVQTIGDGVPSYDFNVTKAPSGSWTKISQKPIHFWSSNSSGNLAGTITMFGGNQPFRSLTFPPSVLSGSNYFELDGPVIHVNPNGATIPCDTINIDCDVIPSLENFKDDYFYRLQIGNNPIYADLKMADGFVGYGWELYVGSNLRRIARMPKSSGNIWAVYAYSTKLEDFAFLDGWSVDFLEITYPASPIDLSQVNVTLEELFISQAPSLRFPSIKPTSTINVTTTGSPIVIPSGWSGYIDLTVAMGMAGTEAWDTLITSIPAGLRMGGGYFYFANETPLGPAALAVIAEIEANYGTVDYNTNP